MAKIRIFFATIFLLCGTYRVGGQDLVVDDKETSLPALRESFDKLAIGFEEGELTATVRSLSTFHATINLQWRGKEAIWRMEQYTSDQPFSVDEFVAKSTPVVIVLSHHQLIEYYPQRATVTIFPWPNKSQRIPMDINVVPTHFWKSGQKSVQTWARSLDPKVLAATTSRVEVTRRESQITVIRHPKDERDGMISLHFQASPDGLYRMTHNEQEKTRTGGARQRVNFRWEKLGENGGIYLAESKVWQATGSEPAGIEPHYVYLCKSISKALPKETKFDLAALKLPEGTKLEFYDERTRLTKTEFVGDATKHEQLLGEQSEIARLKKIALPPKAAP
jgi:hypothetical protein